jgi:hypothetical protein
MIDRNVHYVSDRVPSTFAGRDLHGNENIVGAEYRAHMQQTYTNTNICQLDQYLLYEYH